MRILFMLALMIPFLFAEPNTVKKETKQLAKEIKIPESIPEFESELLQFDHEFLAGAYGYGRKVLIVTQAKDLSFEAGDQRINVKETTKIKFGYEVFVESYGLGVSSLVVKQRKKTVEKIPYYVFYFYCDNYFVKKKDGNYDFHVPLKMYPNYDGFSFKLYNDLLNQLLPNKQQNYEVFTNKQNTTGDYSYQQPKNEKNWYYMEFSFMHDGAELNATHSRVSYKKRIPLPQHVKDLKKRPEGSIYGYINDKDKD